MEFSESVVIVFERRGVSLYSFMLGKVSFGANEDSYAFLERYKN